MKKVITVAVATVVAALGSVLLAPSAWAMVPPEPAGGGSGTSSTSTTLAGIATWQVVAIVLVAVAIGAVGTYFAQRTHRQSEARSVSMA
jgi:uncharacterized protein HemX